MTPALRQTFGSIAAAARNFADDWWIIGSAGVAAVGGDPGRIQDVDLLLSDQDAAFVLRAWPTSTARGGATAKFRSRTFARFEHLPLPVEIMAGFEICVSGDWRAVNPATRISASGVFAPHPEEQIAILRLMGREKDATRIAALNEIIAVQPNSG